ncbi:MAG: hypothetical protein HW421_3961 [Ignavibacteria bacterium]|nr:hypothetical protein [Ignavibacteria bacterium]
MKQLIFIFTMIFLYIPLLKSQDIEPSAMTFTYKVFDDNGTSQTITDLLKSDNFPQRNFIRTWQWGSGNSTEKITDETLMNSAQNHNITTWGTSNCFTDNPNYIYSNPKNAIMGLTRDEYIMPLMANSLQYSPRLKLDHSGQFKVNPNDSMNNIFGFKKVIGDTSSDNQRIVLHKNQGYDNSYILEDPWIMGELYKNDDSQADQLNDKVDEWNGQHWLITINLRRYNNDGEKNDYPVLSIEIPYTTLSSNSNTLSRIAGYIKFDKLPESNVSSTFNRIHLNYSGDRGWAMNLRDVVPITTTFTITNNMLPNSSDSFTDISISASFTCNPTISPFNQFLKYSGSSNDIDSLMIKVYYHGGTDVAIKYIRIENPEASKLFRGIYDYQEGIKYSSSTYSLHSIIQTQYLDFLDSKQNYKLFRFYGMTSDDGNVIRNWGTLRYLNKLMPGMWTTSLGVGIGYWTGFPNNCNVIMDHYSYFVNSKSNWYGCLAGTRSDFPVPYIRGNFKLDDINNIPLSKDIDTYGLGFYSWSGYRGLIDYWGINNCCSFEDTLNSHYETYLRFKYDPIISCTNTSCTNTRPTLSGISSTFYSLDDYWDFLNVKYFWSYQNLWEGRTNYPFYYKKTNWLYSDVPWWSQVFVGSNWHNYSKHPEATPTYYDGIAIGSDNFRPQTGEEMRAMLWVALTRGAKGLCYDRINVVNYTRGYSSTVSEHMEGGIGYHENYYNSSTLTGLKFIYSEYIGGDFIKTNNDPLEFDKFIAFDSATSFLGVDSNRIYRGMRSPRVEIYKTHAWINQVDSILMRLRLACIYSKGYKTWFNQDPKYNDVIIQKFIAKPTNYNSYNNDIDKMRFVIDTAQIKLRSVGKTKLVYGVSQPYYQAYDSAFFDITILRDKDDSTMDGSKPIYVGVFNRRSDPLIRTTDSLPWGIDSTMKFFSTAEFDDSCGVSPDPTKWSVKKDDWKKFWWKRQGAREISIPFNVTPYDTTQYTLLRISELGADNAYLNNPDSCPWRKPEFYHKVDTVIRCTGSNLVVRLLPGEGKILKVEQIKGESNIQGYLAHSNQCKIVAYPAYQDSIYKFGSDSMRYHATYYRYDSVKNCYAVYYKRSYPMDKFNPTNIINWEPQEHLISDQAIVFDTPQNTYNCKYPSIVVRFDYGQTPPQPRFI